MPGEDDNRESVLQADAPEDLQALERMIAADEAADAASKAARESGRDERGRFTGDAGSSNGQRPGQRATPETISARRAADNEAEGGDSAGTSAANQSQKAEGGGQKAEVKPEAGGQKPPEKPPEQQQQNNGNGNQSAYAKERDRRDNSWKALNAEKESFKAETEARRQELELREQTLKAREAALSRPVTYRGYTAEQLDAGAKTFAQKAAALEQAGDFEAADEQRALAQESQARAAELRRQAAAAGVVSPEAAWATLKQDAPELLQLNSPMNQEMRALLQAQPQVLEGPHGPYRAALLVGKKVVGRLEAEVQKHRAEAAKVPELSKQIETLTARVKELESLTSLPGDGNGAYNRGGAERNWSDLSTAEQEAHLNRELAGHVG